MDGPYRTKGEMNINLRKVKEPWSSERIIKTSFFFSLLAFLVSIFAAAFAPGGCSCPECGTGSFQLGDAFGVLTIVSGVVLTVTSIGMIILVRDRIKREDEERKRKEKERKRCLIERQER